MIDSLDYKILEVLSAHGRITWAELASILQLSSPSTAERVKRLEEKGIITGYAAILNYHEIGFAVTAFISVTLEHPKHIAEFLRAVQALAEIVECHHVAGDEDYLLKVRCRSNQELDTFLNSKLKVLKGIHRTRTTIALSSAKERS